MINKIKALVAVGCLALAPAAFAVPFSVSVSYSGFVGTAGEWGLFGPTTTGGLFALGNGQTYTANRDISAGTYLWEIGGAGLAGGTTWSIFANGALIDSGAAGSKRSYVFADGGSFKVPEPGTLALLGLGLLGIGFSVRRRQTEA